MDVKLFLDFYEAFLEFLKTIEEDKKVVLENRFRFKRLYENITSDGRFNEIFEEFQREQEHYKII